jgi:hypothetical protein
LFDDPIKQEPIYLRAGGLHKITGQAIPRISIDVQKPDAGVKPERSSSESRF